MKIYFKILFLFACLSFIAISSHGQNQNKIDELTNKLKSQPADTTRVLILLDLSWELKSSNPKQAIRYANEALNLSMSLNYKKGLALGFKNKGVALYYMKELDSALSAYQNSIRYMKEINDKLGEAKIYNNIGNIYEFKSDLPNALTNYLNYLKASEEANDKYNIAKALNNVGLIYWRMENYDNKLEIAMGYHKRSLALRQEIKDESGIATSYANIGLVYDAYAAEVLNKITRLHNSFRAIQNKYIVNNKLDKNNKDYQKERENYLKDSLRLERTRQRYLDTSLNFYLKSIELREKLNEKQLLAQVMSNIANVYWQKKNKEKYNEYQKKILEIYEEIGDYSGLATQYYNKASSLSDERDYVNAIKFYNLSLEYATKIEFWELVRDNFKALSISYSALKRFEEAYDYLDKYVTLKDSLNTVESGNKISEMQAKYDTEKKQKEIELLNKDNELKQSQLRNSQLLIYFFIGGFVLVIIFATFIFRAYKQKQRANKLLAEQKEEIQYQAHQLELANIELEKLSIVASETDNAVTIADENGNIEWINNGFTKLFGYTLEEFVSIRGKNVYETSSNEDIREVISTAIKEKRSIVYDSPTRTKSGEEIWTQTTLTPILNSEGKLRKIVTIDSDITKIKKAEEEIRKQKEEIEIKNKHITDSIRYAKRIQQAILPPIATIQKTAKECFVLFRPKDIVSGDFYWLDEKDGKLFFSAVDCTGHGVPGAFMSIVGNNILNQALHEQHLTKPSDILNYLSFKVNSTLRRDKEIETDHAVKDGMDLALCALNRETLELEFAGVHNPMLIVRGDEVLQFKPENHPIGEPFNENFQGYTNNVIPVQKGDIIYVFSDGYVDQFGGPQRKKFMSKRFKETLLAIKDLPMDQQREKLNQVFEDWKGNIEQYDDVLVMGIKV